MLKDPTQFRERFKRWKEGMPAYKNGKPIDDEWNPNDTYTADAGMIKSKIAIDSHFGNPTMRRIANYDGRDYIFPNQYDEVFPGIYEQRKGNVYLGSHDNYIVPGIQDVDGQLLYIELPRINNLSIKFPRMRDAWSFGENYKKYAPMMKRYSNGKPILPLFDGGKDAATAGGFWNQYDNFVNDHPTIATVASFLPYVGSVMDLREAYKNPTAENIGYAALSGISDIFGGRLLMKVAGEGIKLMKALKKLAKSLKKEYSSWPYYQNMPKNEAKREINSIVKQKISYQRGDVATTISPYVGAASIYFPDFLANINQHQEQNSQQK